jgi:hypothetical protein
MAAAAQPWPGIGVVGVEGGVGVDVGVDAVSVVVLVSEPPPLQALKMVRHIAVIAAVHGLDFIIFMAVSLLNKSKRRNI